jgi:hypothetical protein
VSVAAAQQSSTTCRPPSPPALLKYDLKNSFKTEHRCPPGFVRWLVAVGWLQLVWFSRLTHQHVEALVGQAADCAGHTLIGEDAYSIRV